MPDTSNGSAFGCSTLPAPLLQARVSALLFFAVNVQAWSLPDSAPCPRSSAPKPSGPLPELRMRGLSRPRPPPVPAPAPFPHLSGRCLFLSDPSTGRYVTSFSLRVPVLQTRERSTGRGESPITVSFRLCRINLLFAASLSSCRGPGSPWALSSPQPALPSLFSGATVRAERSLWRVKWLRGCSLRSASPSSVHADPPFTCFPSLNPSLTSPRSGALATVREVGSRPRPRLAVPETAPTTPAQETPHLLSRLGILGPPTLS